MNAANSETGGDNFAQPENASSLFHDVSLPTDTGVAATDAPEGRAAAAIPCLFVTTAYQDEISALPGPKQKQAQTLVDNIKWLAETCGKEKIGFLTLTIGDLDTGGRFRNLRDRKEAQRRFHSLLTNVIAKHFLCGVVVTERHQNGGIHFHLVVVCAEDIRGNLDFAACFPPKDKFGKPTYKPDYSTANDAIQREWAFWRRICKNYGFGRHQLQPMRENSEALGRYIGAYLKKDWNHRWPEDKGARCVRYFGHWSKEPRKKCERSKSPPFNSRFGWMHPRSRAWREMVKQIVIVLKSKGAKITELNIKFVFGRRWAWKMGKLFEHVRFEPGEWLDAATRLAVEEHNSEVKVRWLNSGGNEKDDCWWHITEITLDHLRPSPQWKKQRAGLQMAKDAEAAIRKGLRQLAKKKNENAEQLRLLQETADELVNCPVDFSRPAPVSA